MKRKVLNRGFIELTDFLGDEKHSITAQHMVFNFHVKCPIFVANQWSRHNGSSFTKVRMSGAVEYYVPVHFKSYKQHDLSETDTNIIYKKIDNYNKWAINFYNKLIGEHSISPEQAEIILPQSLFTEFHWTVSASGLMRFLKYKLLNDSNFELQEYSKVLLDLFKEKIPGVAKSFLRREFGK